MEKQFVERHISEHVLQLAREFPAVCITGPRQTGKSTLLKHLFPQHTYVTLDDPIWRQRFISDPTLALDMLRAPCIIDEIQYVPQLMPYLKMRIDADRVNGRYILSGSQMFNLMQGLSESLAGRVGLCELFGLSFAEFRPGDVACETAELFGRFIVGGYPEPAVHGVTPQNFYGAYLQTYLERDVRQIRSVHDLSLFQRFVEMLAARCGGILNLSDLGRSCGISHTLAQQWLSILEMTRIVYVLRPYFMNVSKRLVKSPKVYFSDTGLLCYLLKYAEPQTLWAGPSAGHVFENAMISEWLKFKANTAGLFELYFVRDAKGQEVDLLLDAGQKKIGIEFKLSAAPSLQDADGMRALLGDVLTHGYVVSCHQGTVPLNKGITAMPWYAMCADMGRIF